jgi:uncharacterized protein
MLAVQTCANFHLVILFAFFQDACRLNEREVDGHVTCGAELTRHLKGKFFDATNHEMALVCYACEHHSDGMSQGDITVLTCWDADRLDLWRVGITPKPDACALRQLEQKRPWVNRVIAPGLGAMSMI